MQSWSSKAPNGRIQQHKHTKHGAKNDQSRILAHSRIVQLHCMFSASEYPQICSDYWLFYQLYSTSSLFLKNFASQSSPACVAGTQCASFSTSKITKNYPQNPESLSFHRNCLQIHQKNSSTHPKKKNKSKKSVIPKKKSTSPSDDGLRLGSCCHWAAGSPRCRSRRRRPGRPGIPGPPGGTGGKKLGNLEKVGKKMGWWGRINLEFLGMDDFGEFSNNRHGDAYCCVKIG